MDVTAYSLAKRYLNIEELEGGQDHPLIQWWLMLAGFGPNAHDEVPWCAAFVHGIAWSLGLPRPHLPARARSWLEAGMFINEDQATQGFDIVVLQRGTGYTPGPEVFDAPGHVGFFSHYGVGGVVLLGGNQGDSVSVEEFPLTRVLGYRRLLWG